MLYYNDKFKNSVDFNLIELTAQLCVCNNIIYMLCVCNNIICNNIIYIIYTIYMHACMIIAAITFA